MPAYFRLVEMLEEASNFKFRNYSVPSHDPVIDPDTTAGDRKLREMLRAPRFDRLTVS